MLTNTLIKHVKPKDKPYKISDEKGMYLLVNTNGSKLFRFNYRIHGKQKTFAIGTYPDVSLKLARERRDLVRKQIAEGIDPMEEKKTQGNLFVDIAMMWFEARQRTIEPMTHKKKLRRFDLHVFPVIGHIAIGGLKSPDVFNVVRPLIQKLKIDSAHRIRAEISEIYAYAIAHGYTEYDPSQAVAKQLPPNKAKHHPALTEPKDVARLMRAIYAYNGTYVVQQALRITPLLFQRPGEIRTMQWADIDFATKEWRYLVTKTKIQHIVPLSDQVIKILRNIEPLTGSGKYVFPSSRNDARPMSDNAIRKALRTMGYTNDDVTPHGFRTTASTLLNEQGWSPDAIERQLSHMPKDQVRAAYNRAQYLEERRRMMQSWADYLDSLKNGADVIPIRKQV